VPLREPPLAPVVALISRRLVRRDRSEDLFFEPRLPVSGVVPRGEVVGVHDLGIARLGQPCSVGGLSSSARAVNSDKSRFPESESARPYLCCKVLDAHPIMMSDYTGSDRRERPQRDRKFCRGGN
jgi:hypothetical protein